ncbi:MULTISPECIES: hypothetical protein [Acidaminococcus]
MKKITSTYEKNRKDLTARILCTLLLGACLVRKDTGGKGGAFPFI